MLLSIYFNTLGPAIQQIARANSPTSDREWKRAFKEVNQLPPTWRQVRRITTSVLLIVYAYWHGEVSHDEAGRACAHALALLEFQRMRWGTALNDARQSIFSLTSISGINIRSYLEDALSGANEGLVTNILSVDRISAQADQIQEQQAYDGESSVLQDWESDSLGDILTSANLFPGPFPLTEWDFESSSCAHFLGMEKISFSSELCLTNLEE